MTNNFNLVLHIQNRMTHCIELVKQLLLSIGEIPGKMFQWLTNIIISAFSRENLSSGWFTSATPLEACIQARFSLWNLKVQLQNRPDVSGCPWNVFLHHVICPWKICEKNENCSALLQSPLQYPAKIPSLIFIFLKHLAREKQTISAIE